MLALSTNLGLFLQQTNFLACQNLVFMRGEFDLQETTQVLKKRWQVYGEFIGAGVQGKA